MRALLLLPAVITLWSTALAAAGPLGVRGSTEFVIVRPAGADGSLAIHTAPGGNVLARLRGRTSFGSPLALNVARVRGRWLGVRTDVLPNGRLGWIDGRRAALRTSTTRLWLEADLSERQLSLHRGDEIVRRMPIGVGRPTSPTPTGSFAVTDKLVGASVGAGYGCCVLALTGHQNRLPAGWSGGDRIAIHGGSSASLGAAISAGCMRARGSDLRLLMRILPLGALVVVHQ